MTTPQDPFGPLHANSLSMLESIRGYRAAGGSWLETAIALAAAFIAAHVVTGGGQQDQEG
jgi:hypothetical protein